MERWGGGSSALDLWQDAGRTQRPPCARTLQCKSEHQHHGQRQQVWFLKDRKLWFETVSHFAFLIAFGNSQRPATGTPTSKQDHEGGRQKGGL